VLSYSVLPLFTLSTPCARLRRESEIILYFNLEICMHHSIIFFFLDGGCGTKGRGTRSRKSFYGFGLSAHTHSHKFPARRHAEWLGMKYNENNLYVLPLCKNVCVETVYNRSRNCSSHRLLAVRLRSTSSKGKRHKVRLPLAEREIKGISFNDLSQSSDRVTRAIKSKSTERQSLRR
jgi:hypothetical protein